MLVNKWFIFCWSCSCQPASPQQQSTSLDSSLAHHVFGIFSRETFSFLINRSFLSLSLTALLAFNLEKRFLLIGAFNS